MSSLSDILASVDKRIGYAGRSLADTGVITGDFWQTTKKLKDETLLWNEVINRTNSQMTSMGYTVAETNAIMDTLSKGMRLTTENQGQLAKQTGAMTEDIGRLSVLLRTSTEDLAAATIMASKKFGKGAKEMNADLTRMHHELTQMKFASKEATLHLGDLTQQVLESQANFQGYNLSLRDQARLMGNIALKAQEQGATYEQSMKAAQGLSDVLTGGKAPDWAKYIAGRELLKEIKTVRKKAGEKDEDFEKRIAEQFGMDPESANFKQQIKGMETLAKRYKEFGTLSSANMAEELLRGTKMGNEQMFKLLKKYGTGREGRELLKRVWGLDDAAATAATLAMTTAKNYDDLAGIRDKAIVDVKKRKQPSIADLEAQTTGMVSAINMSQKGIVGSLKAYLDTDSPLVKAVMGLGGLGTSMALQLAQTGMLGGMAGKMGGAAGQMGKIGGVVGKGAMVGAAGVGGYMLGTKLREWSDALAESTDIQYLSIDKLAQLGMDHFAKQLETATFGLVSFRGDLEGAELAAKSYNLVLEQGGTQAEKLLDIQHAARGQFEEASAAYAIQARKLEGLSNEQLKGMSEALDVSFGKLKEIQSKALDGAEFQKRFLKDTETIATKTADKAAEAVAAAIPSTRRERERGVAAEVTRKTVAAKKAEPKKPKAPPVVTITQLTPEQKRAVSQQVATKMAPEIADLSKTMFKEMAEQSTGYFEQLTLVSQTFWTDTLPKMAEVTWDKVTEDFQKKIKRITGPAMTAIDFGKSDATGGGGGGRGEGGGGMAASIGSDGSILIKFMIPRDAIDKSNRLAAAANE